MINITAIRYVRLLLIATVCSVVSQVKAMEWFRDCGGVVAGLKQSSDGSVETSLDFPGSALIYIQLDRLKHRASRQEFDRDCLSVELKAESLSSEPLKGNIFIKDKDGHWFQSRQEFSLVPGQWQTFHVKLAARDSGLVPVGHHGVWNSFYLFGLNAYGVSIHGQSTRSVTLSCRNFHFTGQRNTPALEIHDWRMPGRGEVNRMIKSRFLLSREYANPFDPEEIQADVIAELPDGRRLVWPAFFTQDYETQRHFTREYSIPAGEPAWEFRYTPTLPGRHRIQLVIKDRTPGAEQEIRSPWQHIQVVDSSLPGFIRPWKGLYFRHDNGKFFFPVGMNIHTNIDLRSEKAFQFGHLPDRGVLDYEEYFNAMADNGMNACEIWMASWTFAIEWTSAIAHYHGLGRYNLANAARLDHILDYAAERGIMVHLVLDNHGKLSSHSDQEWDMSPFNRNNVAAKADGGFLDQPKEFFTNPEAVKLNRQRNRYIAARWGAYPSIMSFELWSEVNLVTGFQELYDDDTGVAWHANAIQDFNKFSQAGHMMCTHYSGDYNTNLKYSRLCALPGAGLVVGDAYRNERIPFIKHMRVHGEVMRQFNKPALITEFGGTWKGADKRKVVGDLHSGIWSAFFKQQAGTPFLWWHDFVHIFHQYHHFRGFAAFIRDVCPIDRDFRPKELDVVHRSWLDSPHGSRLASALAPRRPLYNDYAAGYSPLTAPLPVDGVFNPDSVNYMFNCFATGNSSEVYGWIFTAPYCDSYPEAEERVMQFDQLVLVLDYRLDPGEYELSFFDTITGELVRSQTFSSDGTMPRRLVELPAFGIDIAFKIRRIWK